MDGKKNGIGMILKEEFAKNVLEVKRVSERVLSLNMKVKAVILNVVSGFVIQVVGELEEKEEF